MRKHTFILLLSLMVASKLTLAQDDSCTTTDLGRTFMPTVQMGYVYHGTSQLAGGLMTQTSLEYRDISNFVFRINYDAFNSKLQVSYPLDTTTTYTGRTTFSDLIIGAGYRMRFGKEYFTNYLQTGVKFYGFPVFNAQDATINFDMNSRRVGLIRYSLGYEYEINPKLFLTFEGHSGYVFKPVDFWENNQWSFGATLGISAPI